MLYSSYCEIRTYCGVITDSSKPCCGSFLAVLLHWQFGGETSSKDS